MRIELFTRALAAQRRSGLIWGGALLLLTVSVLSVWPSLSDSGGLDTIADGLSPELVAALGMENFGSPVGYLNGNLYAMILPLLFGAFAIMQMNALTAADEDAGRLELLLALPVGRTGVYLARFLAVALVLAAVGLVVGAAVGFGAPALDMELEAEGVVAITLAVFLLALFHGALAMALAGLGLRGPATLGITFGVLVLGYLSHALLPLVEALEDGAVASPWQWALGEMPLANGIDGTGLALLAGGALLFALVGLLGVRNRTIRSA